MTQQEKHLEISKVLKAINGILKPLESALGAYDFGGNNFIAPSPMEMNFSGRKHNTYVICFEVPTQETQHE
jgi:hypothetical protein